MRDLYARTEKGLEKIDGAVEEQDKEALEAPKKQAKKARMVALAQVLHTRLSYMAY